MSKTTFKVAFDGTALRDGEIDVRDLAPALLALGDVVQAANRALNGDRADARLKMKATRRGSFEALLAIDVSILSVLGDLLDSVSAHPDRVTAADALLDLLIKGGSVLAGGTAGLFAVLKMLKGQRPDRIETSSDGTTTIVHNHTAIVIDPRTLTLLNDEQTRKAVDRFAEKSLTGPSIDSVRIADGEGRTQVEIFESDRQAMAMPDPIAESENLPPEERKVWLRIITSAFRDGYKWRFSDGGEKPFAADVEDVGFVNGVLEGTISLSANDTLLCLISEQQSIGPGGLSKTVKVLKVLEHVPGAKQMRFL